LILEALNVFFDELVAGLYFAERDIVVAGVTNRDALVPLTA
jgi:hypothetical protein